MHERGSNDEAAPAVAGDAGTDGAIRSLPILQPARGSSTERPRTIRRSKSGRRRAIVLGVIQLLIVLHVVQWALTGRTMSPVEPSESIQFSTEGVINAGLIMFVLALVSTALLGRWFCGWACHVVLLQDGCLWLLKRVGIRPRPFRSRLLILVPLGLAIYMFLWPMIVRWGVIPLDAALGEALGSEHAFVAGYRAVFGFFDLALPAGRIEPWRLRSEIVVEDFWSTFPGLLVAIPFLLVCGFGTVYFLGAKGFCTYGCPYGGFFAPLDRLSPHRIRVSDACEGCGHCTAVCTSNVRVHQEVRDYGMVVDPGCMKCLDCVSVCPNDALSVGWGRPAVGLEGIARRRAEARRARGLEDDGGRSRRPRPDLTWTGEIVLLAVFLLIFASVRGLYGLVPLLFAVGIAGCLTWMAWTLWRLARERNVNLHRTRLKLAGRWRTPGVVFATVTAACLALVVHGGVVQAALGAGEQIDRGITISIPAALAAPEGIDPDEAARARRALALLGVAAPIGDGGLALLPSWRDRVDRRRAGLLALLGETERAEAMLRSLIDRAGPEPATVTSLAVLLESTGRGDEAFALVTDALAEPAHAGPLPSAVLAWSVTPERQEAALAALDARLERWPADLAARRVAAQVSMRTGRWPSAIEHLEFILGAGPADARLHAGYAAALAIDGRVPDALAAAERGLAAHPDDPGLQAQVRELRSAVEQGGGPLTP